MITQQHAALAFAWLFISVVLWGSTWAGFLYFTEYRSLDLLRWAAFSVPIGLFAAVFELPSAWYEFLLDVEASMCVFVLVYGSLAAISDGRFDRGFGSDRDEVIEL